MALSVSCNKRLGACDDPVQVGYSLLDVYDTKDLGEAMLCSPGIARNKLNPECDSNHQTLAQAVAVSVRFDDDRQLAAWAAKRGKALVDIPADCTCEEELADQLMVVSEVVGALHAEIRRAREDGVIDPQEHQAIHAAAIRAMREVLNLDASIGSQVREFPTNGQRPGKK